MASAFLDILYYISSVKFFISCLVIVLLRFLIKPWLIRKKLPPGPAPIPLMGNLLAFRGAKGGNYEIMLELSKKYGDPTTIWFGHSPCVVLNKYELAKVILQQPTFSSRLDSALLDSILEGGQDIEGAKYGPLWQFHRKVASKCIREVIAAEKLENKVSAAVDAAVEHMMKQHEEIDAAVYMHHIAFNIISSFTFGKVYQCDDPELLHQESLRERANQELAKAIVYDFLPYAKYLPLHRVPKVKSMMKVIDAMKSLRNQQIEEHKKTYQSGDIRGFCDAITRERDVLKRERSEEDQLTEKHIFWIIMDLYNAGIDTTASSLTWFVLYMVIHPEIQEECYQAINKAIGDRRPRLDDRVKMPIVEACIMEALRLRPPAPLGLPHVPTSDASIVSGDYIIPAGTLLLANIYAMHIDPEYWERPMEFNPHLHFLDSNYGLIKKPPSFAPFGFGRRVCLGETLARNDLFLVASTLLQRVELKPMDGVEYNTDYDVGKDLTMEALPFRIRVEYR